MKLVIDIPDGTSRIDVLCDGVRRYCTDSRYQPGYWNGLNGGTHYGQYFDMDDVDRVREMVAVATLLNAYKVKYDLSKLKRRYRIMISAKDYYNMNETLKDRILKINIQHEILSEGGIS